MSTDVITSTNQEMGKEAYMQMLTVQLQNQDPMNPVNNNQFMADLAQFSSLEQMTNMNRNLEKLIDVVGGNNGMGGLDMTDMIKAQMGTWQLSELRAAEGMIGRQITFADPEADPGLDSDPDAAGQTVTERVNAVVLDKGVVWLSTDSFQLNMTDVLRIEE